jgi:hypothetical protein
MRFQNTYLFLPALFLFTLSCGNTNSVDQSSSAEAEAVSIDSSALTTEYGDVVAAGPNDILQSFLSVENENYLYGYKNQNDQVVIAPQFELAWNFENGLAAVCKGDQHGFCDITGKISLLPEGIKFAVFYNDMAGGLEFASMSEGMILLVNEAESKYGFVNMKNELVVPCIYDNAEAYSEGYSCVYNDNKAGFIDKSGNIHIDLTYSTARSFHEGLAPVSFENGLYGFINTSGELVIETKFAGVEQFSDGLCLARYPDNAGIFFIDRTGETAIAGPFEEASYFWEGEATVKENGKCKVINKTGKKLRTVSCDYFELGC